jgi:hypothetical protein
MSHVFHKFHPTLHSIWIQFLHPPTWFSFRLFFNNLMYHDESGSSTGTWYVHGWSWISERVLVSLGEQLDHLPREAAALFKSIVSKYGSRGKCLVYRRRTWRARQPHAVDTHLYRIDAPTSQNIRRWYKQFEETGCLDKGKSTGWHHVSRADERGGGSWGCSLGARASKRARGLTKFTMSRS